MDCFMGEQIHNNLSDCDLSLSLTCVRVRCCRRYLSPKETQTQTISESETFNCSQSNNNLTSYKRNTLSMRARARHWPTKAAAAIKDSPGMRQQQPPGTLSCFCCCCSVNSGVRTRLGIPGAHSNGHSAEGPPRSSDRERESENIKYSSRIL